MNFGYFRYLVNDTACSFNISFYEIHFEANYLQKMLLKIISHLEKEKF